MGIEIERKFLVKNETWKSDDLEGLRCRQGYLVAEKENTVRIRIIGEQAFLTIKGKTSGISRSEFEYEVPVEDAESLLMLCGSIIDKTRYEIEHEDMLWELDIFAGDNAGLVVAEIELETEDQSFVLPVWVGKEVSADPRYFNAVLSKHPFSQWGVL
jgi:adenylate cyclase